MGVLAWEAPAQTGTPMRGNKRAAGKHQIWDEILEGPPPRQHLKTTYNVRGSCTDRPSDTISGSQDAN